MFRRKDVWIIAAVLVLAAALYGGMLLGRRGQTLSGEVAVSVDGRPYATARLDTPGEIRVEQLGGDWNLLIIEDGAVRMASSSCKNQLCVHQGAMSADNWAQRAMGRTIVCLPNRVLVELALDGGHPSLDDPDAPDI